MSELLLLKDTKKRPSLGEIFKMSTMQEMMKKYGYSSEGKHEEEKKTSVTRKEVIKTTSSS